MLKICLVFWESEPQYAYKRYAYEKNMYRDRKQELGTPATETWACISNNTRKSLKGIQTNTLRDRNKNYLQINLLMHISWKRNTLSRSLDMATTPSVGGFTKTN